MLSAHRTLGAQLLMIVVVLIGLGFGYSFAREVVQAQRLANQAELGRQENAALAAENRKLARDLQYYQSDAYAELRARTDLNMRRPDEQIVLPVLPTAEADTPAAAAGTSSTSSRGPAPDAAKPAGPAPAPVGRNWDRWLGLFNPAGH